jgi:hypothetical protein
LTEKYTEPTVADKLESGEPAEFAEIYVRKVIHAWIKERKSQSPEAVDHGWGSAGLRGTEAPLPRGWAGRIGEGRAGDRGQGSAASYSLSPWISPGRARDVLDIQQR